LDHVRQMLKDHPITNDAVKNELREKLHHIQTELQDYAQHMTDVKMDETIEVEKETPDKVVSVVKVEEKKDEKVKMDAMKLHSIHAKLDQIRQHIIEHPLNDPLVKKEVESKLHDIKDKLEDYAETRGYEIPELETEDEKEIVVPELPVPEKKAVAEDAAKKDAAAALGAAPAGTPAAFPAAAAAPAPVAAPAKKPASKTKSDFEQKRYDALEDRLKQIRDELATNPIKDEATREAIDNKLLTITAKLSDMQQKTEDVPEKKEEVIVAKPELKKDEMTEKTVEKKLIEDVPEKKEEVEVVALPAVKEDEVKEAPVIVTKVTKDQVKKERKDELEEHLAELKTEMKELKKDYADLNEEKVVKDEKETEKSQAGQANDVITDWEAELDAMHDA